MAEPFLGEIKVVAFNFAPRNWAFCDGQLLPISQNQALFSLLGTTFGGDGRSTFALPDLRGRTPIHSGEGFLQGQKGGEETHTLILQEMPTHRHPVRCVQTAAETNEVAGALPAVAESNAYLAGSQDLVPLGGQSIANAGGSQAHENMQPFLALNFAIALQGIFPSQ